VADHHHTNNIRQYSSKPKAAGTLAAQLRVLREFLNLCNDDAGAFRAEYPDFFLSDNLTEKGWVDGFLIRLGGAGPSIVNAGALHLAQLLSEKFPSVGLRMRDIVRLIWQGESFANEYLKALLYGTRVEFNWKRGELVYEPQNDFERALGTVSEFGIGKGL
jgi:hypothetical protein